MEFDLLLKLKELEKETNFHFAFDRDNQEIYLFEPNSKESFDKINIQEYLKESENGNPIKRPDSTRVERCSSNVIGRIRGIIKEREDRSRAEIAGDNRLRTKDRQLHQFYGSQIWNQELSSQERELAEQFKKELEAQKESLKQSQSYKQKALKSYQQQGVSLTPINTKEILTKCQEALRADKGFRTEQTLKTTVKYLARDCNISQQEAQKYLNTALEIEKAEKQQESKQEKQSQIIQNIQELKESQEIKQEIQKQQIQTKAIPQESKKEILKPISKTKPTIQAKPTKEPYRGR